MSAGFFADPDAMENAVDGAADAAHALTAAREALSTAQAQIESSLSWNVGSARHKTSTFVRQWREEFEILALSVVKFDEAVRAAAHAYRNGENSLSAAVAEATGGSGS